MKPADFLKLALVVFAGAAIFIFKERPSQPCANSHTCVNDLSVQVDNQSQAVFMGQSVQVPEINLALDTQATAAQTLAYSNQGSTTAVLGDQDSQVHKHIYVDLQTQKLYAYEDTNKVFETLVSTGLWGWTPTGEFDIWIKIRSQLMSGGSGADYYYLPNVPYVMFFYNNEIPQSRGYGLHGAYWHNNYGNEMSHGCVNLRPIDAKFLYEWTHPVATGPTTRATKEDPGTKLTICNQLQIKEGAIPVCLE